MDEQRARQLLADARATVERRLGDLEHHEAPDDIDSGDPGEPAPHLRDAEIELGMADDLRARLAAIEAAEQRLEDGTYGVSVESGEQIPDERLELIPWAERTTEEQARLGAG